MYHKAPFRDEGKTCAWIAFVSGLLTNVVLFNAGHIAIATHNAATPLAFIFLLLLGVWGAAPTALCRGYRLVPISGILFSIPATCVFLWIVVVHIVPFYIERFSGNA